MMASAIAGQNSVGAKPCGRCQEWTTSATAVMDVLNNKWQGCENCAHQAVMNTVTEQFRMRRPRWWIVGGNVVIPMWVVELLRKSTKLL